MRPRGSFLHWLGLALLVATATLSGGQVDDHRRRLMEAKSALDAANYSGNLERLNQIIEDFARLSSQDRSDWLADYHAGYGHFVMALMVGPGGLLTREGDAARAEHHTAESIRHLERALTRAPNSAESLALLAHLYTMTLRAALPDQREALRARSRALLSSALTRSPRNPRAVLIDAMRLVYSPTARGGDRNKGFERWREALSLFATERSEAVLPDWGHAEGWAWLAGLQLRLNPPQRAEAKRSVARALEIRPGWVWVTKSVLPRF